MGVSLLDVRGVNADIYYRSILHVSNPLSYVLLHTAAAYRTRKLSLTRCHNSYAGDSSQRCSVQSPYMVISDPELR
jgi:hypothetical protein